MHHHLANTIKIIQYLLGYQPSSTH